MAEGSSTARIVHTRAIVVGRISKEGKQRKRTKLVHHGQRFQQHEQTLQQQQHQQEDSGRWRRQPLEITVPEHVAADYGLFLWPCAARLAEHLWRMPPHLLAGKAVLELGAGTGLPGLAAAQLGAARVVLSDRARAADVLANLQLSVSLNNLQTSVSVMGLDWGVFSLPVLALPPPDIILAADVFYDRQDYDAILGTMRFYLEQKPTTAYALVAYQHRTSLDTLFRACSRWQLRCTPLDVKHNDGDNDADGGDDCDNDGDGCGGGDNDVNDDYDYDNDDDDDDSKYGDDEDAGENNHEDDEISAAHEHISLLRIDCLA